VKRLPQMFELEMRAEEPQRPGFSTKPLVNRFTVSN